MKTDSLQHNKDTVLVHRAFTHHRYHYLLSVCVMAAMLLAGFAGAQETAPPGEGQQASQTQATSDTATTPPGSDAVDSAAAEDASSSATVEQEKPELPKFGPHNPRQVRVSAKILEWTHSNSLDWGFSLLYLAEESNQSEIMRIADATFPKPSALNDGLKIFLDNIDRNNGAGGFEAVIDMLEQNGDVEILNEPSLVIENLGDKGGEAVAPATITTKTQVPFEQGAAIGGILAGVTNFQDAGINLTVDQLEIVAEDFIRMNINASVTDFAGRVTVALNDRGDPQTVPTMNTRSIKNTILVRDRKLFVTGMLKTTKKFDNSQGVPILSRIPILKYFTSNKHKSDEVQELIFLIRAEILNIPEDLTDY